MLPFWISPRGSTLSFRFLPSASALASHYSASALPFLSLPVFASQWAFPVLCRSFRSHSPSSVPSGWFPIRLSRILSTKLSVCFRSPFPASLPTAVPQVLARRSHSGVLLCFRCLSAHFHFRLRLLSLPLFLFRFSPSRLAVASQVPPFPLSLLRLPLPFSLVSHEVLPVRLYSAFRLFPFVLPSFASHGCSAGARLSVSLRRFSFASAFFRPLPL